MNEVFVVISRSEGTPEANDIMDIFETEEAANEFIQDYWEMSGYAEDADEFGITIEDEFRVQKHRVSSSHKGDKHWDRFFGR